MVQGSRPLQIFGYHGTTESAADQILKSGFKVSTNPWEWLGVGIYFWQDAPLRAMAWAREWNARQRIKGKPAVIEAQICLEDSLDLLDIDLDEKIFEVSEAFQLRLRETGRVLENRYPQHRLDCAFFNFFVGEMGELGLKIRTIRAAMVEGRPILPGSPISHRSHVQVAVRNHNLISEIRRFL